jgi:5S rRNA maturation endonuclease (ribonuclease M5)
VTGRNRGRGPKTDEDRLRDLEDAIDRLREEAESGTVVVEGTRDLAALEWLGIGGHHVVVHRGQDTARLVEELVACPTPVILLMDWDRSGGKLQLRLADQLHARVQTDVDARRRLARVCQCRSLEEVPAELESLRLRAHRRRM